jgi:hypothetical protein
MPESRLLHNSSIVLLNDDNTPGIFSTDFLKESGILPEDAEIDQTVQVPPLTRVIFDGVYQFLAQPNRTMIRVEYEPGQDLDDTVLHEDHLERMAQALAEATKHMRYKAMGINFQVIIAHGGFGSLVSNLPREATTTELAYQVERDGFTVKATLKHIPREGSTESSDAESGDSDILFDLNFHHDLDHEADMSDRNEQIHGLLSKRATCFEQMRELIDETPTS